MYLQLLISLSIIHAFNQIYDIGGIDFYEIQEYDTPLNLNAPDKDTYADNLHNWLGENGQYDYRGVHLGISDAFTGGKAHGGQSHGNTAFNIGRRAVVGTSAFVKEYYKNVGVQETLHPLINSTLSNINSMTDGDEHNLGSVTCSYDTTPMATGYQYAHQNGSCTACTDSFGWATYLTDCTKDAVTITARDEL